ncbi:MAG: HEPN domain-containing protein [Chitinophagales bacterium]
MTEKEQAIALKLKKARALMSEVDVQLQNQFYATAINRLYYSCFHATKALLLTKNLIPKTHSGVVTMLHQHFVLPGLFNQSHAAFFSKLMQERIDDDYGDFMIIEFDMCWNLLTLQRNMLIILTS